MILPDIPTLSAFTTLTLLSLTTLSFYGLGKYIAPPNYGAALTIYTGWGILVTIFTLLASLTTFTLAGPILLLLALGVILAIVPHPTFAHTTKHTLIYSCGIIACTLPLLFIALNAHVFMWDDFAHRLASVFYLVEYQRVPHPDLPPSFSGFPAYPYGLSLVGAIPAWIKGNFQELSLAYFGYIQLFLFTLMVWENIPHEKSGKKLPILATLIIISCTIANPVLVPKILFSGYNDISMGITFTAAAFAALKLAQEDFKLNPRHAVGLGFILSIIIAQKQIGLVLMSALGLGLITFYACTKKLFTRTTIINGFVAVLPPLLIYITWRAYVAHNIVGGEFNIHPLSDWHLSKWNSILYAFWLHLMEKPQLLAPQIIVVGTLIYGYIRRKITLHNSAHVLILLASCAAVIYNMALYFFYISSFSEHEALGAASFDRYNLHISWLCWAAILALSLPVLTRWLSRITAPLWIVPLAGFITCFMLPLTKNYYTPPQNPPVFAELRAYFASLRDKIPSTAAVRTHIASDNPAQAGYINRVATYELRVSHNHATALPATPVYEDFPVVEELHIITDNPELLLQNVQQSGLPISRVHLWTIK